MKGHANFRTIQLTNNFGLTDQAIIREAEALFTTMAAVEGVPDGDYGADHLMQIHAHLLGDMYPWAGQLRTTGLTVGDGYQHSIVEPDAIRADLERVLSSLQADATKNLTPVEFAERMANHYVKLYALSPFPDGNARASRYLLDKFADDHEMQIKWSAVSAEAFHAATVKTLHGDHGAMRAIFRGITDHKDLFDHYGVDAVAAKMSSIASKAGLRSDFIPATRDTTSLKALATHAKEMLKDDLAKFASGQPGIRDWNRTSITHEMSGTIDKASTSQKLREALDHFSSSSQPARSPKLPGL